MEPISEVAAQLESDIHLKCDCVSLRCEMGVDDMFKKKVFFKKR